MTIITKERPILFNAPMVRALLAGAKTQTRRRLVHAVKPKAMSSAFALANESHIRCDDGRSPYVMGYDEEEQCGWRRDIRCPYGVVGDRLWVKETHVIDYEQGEGTRGEIPPGVYFRASDEDSDTPFTTPKWSPSIFMPRWASRITLEITDVRVQRLQDISEKDAKAEGVTLMDSIAPEQVIPKFFGDKSAVYRDVPYRWAYYMLWESINGQGSWDANPWVWALTFKRVKP